jgi:hypothetical protein
VDITSIRFAVKLAIYSNPRDSSRTISDAWPPIGTTVPKVAAIEGVALLARAASAIDTRQPFQRIYRFFDLFNYSPPPTHESMIDMANNRRITKVSRVFLRV